MTGWLPFSPMLLSLLLKLSCNMLLTVQPIFMSRHEFSVATSTGVFNLYVVATVNSLVETLSIHEAIIPCRDIVFLSLQELFSFSVATRSFFQSFSLSLHPISCRNILLLAPVSLLVVTSILCHDLRPLSNIFAATFSLRS